VDKVRIQFSRFSAFYSPLILTIAGNFLKEEGLETEWSIANSPATATKELSEGSVDIIQSAVSQSFNNPPSNIIHFAQINQMDGFFILSRTHHESFDWKKLENSYMILQSGGQPLAMLKYAFQKAGVDFNKIKQIIPNEGLDMEETFKSGLGDYIHHQGPVPQKLEDEGYGNVVAKVGEMVGLCAFSSLAARKEWLKTDTSAAFIRAYTKAKKFIINNDAKVIANMQSKYFPNIKISVLADCINQYKNLGCWEGPINITEESFNASVNIFKFNCMIDETPIYSEVCLDSSIV
tara:strand:- start:4774 stop:5649 length:876 start_codon:yes stop_codon:yes gene_type:complete